MRLPRSVFWALGAAIAVVGALVARGAAEAFPTYQVPLWLLGGGAIFVGLAVLSLGTRGRMEELDDTEPDDGDAGGGPRN